MTEATKNAILSLIRSMLLIAAGVAAGKGWVSNDNGLAIAAAVSALLPALWGYADKFVAERKTQSRIAAALDDPRNKWTQEQREYYERIRTTEAAG